MSDAELVIDGTAAPQPGGRVELTTDENGAFSFHTQARGAVAVNVGAPGMRPFETELTLGPARAQVHDIVVPGAYVRARIVDLARGPLEGIHARIIVGDEQRCAVRSDAQGLVQLIAVPLGPARLEVAGPSPVAGVPVGGRYPFVVHELELGAFGIDLGDVVLGEEAQGALHGIVRGPGEQGLGWVRVYVRPVGGGHDAWEWAASTDFAGRFTVGQRPSGELELFALHADPHGPGARLAGVRRARLDPVDPAGGVVGAPLELDLDAGARVEVARLVVDGETVVSGIEVVDEGGRPLLGGEGVEGQGRFWAGSLPSGPHRLRIHVAGGVVEHAVQVEAGAEHVFRLRDRDGAFEVVAR